MTSPTGRPLRVFMPGCYGRANKGDIALARSFIRWLTEDVGAHEVSTTSFDPVGDAEDLGIPTLAMATRPRHWWHRGTDKVMFKFSAIRPLVTVGRLGYFRLIGSVVALWGALYRRSPRIATAIAPNHVAELAAAITRSDIVFAVPGGYLLGPRPTSDSWLFHVPTFELAHALGKPIALGPCSVGPFHPIYRRAASRLFSKVSVACVREEISRGFLEESATDKRPTIIDSPDMAFWFSRDNADHLPPKILSEIEDEAVPILGVSVRRHYFPESKDPARAQQDYLDTVASAIAQLTTKQSLRVWIVPQTQEDLDPGLRLSELLADRGVRHENRREDLSFEQLRSLYGRLHLLLGTRMHANILAMTAGTPVAAIAYEPKTTGILDSMGLSSWGLDITALGNGNLAELLERQWLAAPDLRMIARERCEAQAVRIDALWPLVSDALELPLHTRRPSTGASNA
ncbi:polysaccharide pyruvyl transferase family protein [Aeromicrobium wangtongii]|uniref:polysaccharide pyruvyl transferase family protein n=1 Tax=Aeromicrobium wangtongii TaxID=2969247 RepID=UPI002017692E|nr:polysaccharide pyruvyl transferase family protein [Aeromicrobium wangtongii]MCL3817238.1 polysaccharide pyruvyl transferase family protein [Aeromicrobium wangtongii]